MGIQNLGTFIGAVLVFLALPGPGTFALLTASGKHGVRAGYATLTGLALGDQALAWLAALGVAALLQANPTAFHALQYLGAAYLVWIGLQLLSKKRSTGGPVRMEPGHFLRQGFLISVLNPKAIIFYMAFFPLFIDPHNHHGLWTIAAMALLIVALSLLYCSALILLGHGMSQQVRRHPRLSRALQKLAGLCLIGFGIRLGIG
ncbi:MAG: LysE family translocator [Xanthomonadaceae bacterium]|nr:LysE family translocator [Xanthomonadaceae bacterium]